MSAVYKRVYQYDPISEEILIYNTSPLMIDIHNYPTSTDPMEVPK